MLTKTDFHNLNDMIENSIKKYGERPFIGTKVAGTYTWLTYGEFDIKMRKLRSVLAHHGIGKGDVVAIIGNNSASFALAVYASYGLGAIMVPMYEVQKIEDWEYILKNSGAKLLFAGSDAIKSQIEGLHIDSLKTIFVIRPNDPKDPNSVDQLIAAETELMDSVEVVEEDIADYIYTSGTTGLPKGAIITHQNILQNVLKIQEVFPIGPTDRTLAFLPWAHEFGKTVELHIFPSVGAAIGLVESNRTIAQNLLEVNPTVLNSVPKIFNKIYDRIHEKTADHPIARILFERTENLAKKARKERLSVVDKIQQKVLDRVVGAKVRAAFGNSLRFCISGGAALSEEIANFFNDFGVTIYEGYGMTETSPIIAVNSPRDGRKIGSVGHPLRGVEVRIEVDPDEENSKQGEVIVGGPCIMRSYLNLPEATAEVLTDAHELRTGDMGYLDEDGYLWLTGRVKEQYKLENGKYVVPSALESRITISTIIECCVIFGANKPYNISIIQPTAEFIQKFRTDNGLENASNEELEKNEKLRACIQEELKKMCEEFRGYEKPRKFFITLDEFTIQNGMLSPALKIKRREVEKKYGERIKALYKD